MKETKSSAKLKAQVMEEVTSYCDRSSIIGANYFFSDITLLERAFWVVAVCIMLVVASIEVNMALAIWSKNPTVTVTDTISDPVSTIQFPTVTICPDFVPDKKGFVRNILNILEFQCDAGDKECSDGSDCTERANCPAPTYDTCPNDALVPGSTNGNACLDCIWQCPRGRLFYDNYDFFDTLLLLLELNPPADGSYEYDVMTIRIDPLTQPMMKEFANLEGEALKRMLKKRMKALVNNYDIFAYFNISYEDPLQPVFYSHPDMYNPDQSSALYTDYKEYIFPYEMQALWRLTNIVLAFPLPGQFGTLHFNFGVMIPDTTTWFCGFWDSGYNKSEDGALDGYFDIILSGMLGGVDLHVAPSEISAILNPVPTYVDARKYPYQFPNTVQKQRMHMGDPLTTAPCTNLFDAAPKVFSMENYFGKLLGPHLKVVMEIMFHCLLRTRAISPDRFLRISNVYGGMDNIQRFMNYTVNFSEPFFPVWSDYQATIKMPYYWGATSLTMDLKVFESKRNEINNPLYNGTVSPNLDDTVRKLRDVYQYQQFLTMCSGPGGNRTCYDKFQPVLTDSGVCYTFNGADLDSAFKNSTYVDMFKTVFEPGNGTDSLLMNEQYGKAFQLYLLLDSHQSKIMDNENGKFKVGISQIYGFMNVRDVAIDVEVGYITRISVVPMQLTTTVAFRDHDMTVRNCKYLNENTDENSLFKFYTFEACIFECRLRHSTSTCGCTPWNYPQYGNGSITEICDGEKSYCFEQEMDAFSKSECECLPDCEEVSFAVSSDKRLINFQQECNITLPSGVTWGPRLQSNDLSLVVAEKIRHMEGEEFVFWYDRLQNNESVLQDMVGKGKFVRYLDPTLTQKKCLQLLENDFAILTIEVSVPTMTALQQDVAVNFFTKISNVGGTLGLFTGMGILSFVEIGFLIYRIIKIACRPVGRKKSIK